MSELRLRNEMPRNGRCSAESCRRAVLWSSTERGKPMILDRFEPLRTEDDGRIAVVSSDATHWASCVARKQFVRR